MESLLRRPLYHEVRVLDEQKHLCEYVASDATLDCYNEVLNPKGCKLDRFAKNAPFVNSHDYTCISQQLGKVVSSRLEKGQVVQVVDWAVDINPLAAMGWKMTVGGYLKAVSVGFLPVKYAWRDQPDFVTYVKDMALDPETAAQCRCIHYEWSQIELSACIIGANPNALAKAFQDGALQEKDLAAVGFAGDREFEFLQLAAATYDQADKLQRMQIELELHRIYRARHLSDAGTPARTSSSATKHSTPPSPHAPGGEDKAKRQAAEQRAEDLAKLTAALKSIPRVTPAS